MVNETLDMTRCADCGCPVLVHDTDLWTCASDCPCDGLRLHEPGPDECPCGETHGCPWTSADECSTAAERAGGKPIACPAH